MGARSGFATSPKPEFAMPVGVSSLKTGGAARNRRVLGRANCVDVERGKMEWAAALARGQPAVGRRVEAAGEDVRRPAGGRARLVPCDPWDRASRTGEIDRRRFGLLGLVDVE